MGDKKELPYESASKALEGLSDLDRAVVAAAYKRRGGKFGRWRREDWPALEAAIFERENELEHRGARSGCSDHEPVLGMRRRRVALEAMVGEGYPMQVVRYGADGSVAT